MTDISTTYDVGIMVTVKNVPYEDGHFIKMDVLYARKCVIHSDADRESANRHSDVHKDATCIYTNTRDYASKFRFIQSQAIIALHFMNRPQMTLVVWDTNYDRSIYDEHDSIIDNADLFWFLDDGGTFIEMKYTAYRIKITMNDMMNAIEE